VYDPRVTPRDEDLEDFWSDLKNKPKPGLVTLAQHGSLEGTLDFACTKTLHDMRAKYEPIMDAKTWGGLLNALNDIVRRLKAHIETDFRARGPAGLVELVLSDTSLSTAELKDFVRALPESLVRRICEEGATANSAKGIHALMSFEWHYRQNRARFRGDYTITRQGDGVLEASIHPSGGDLIVFRLDDSFSMRDSGVGSK